MFLFGQYFVRVTSERPQQSTSCVTNIKPPCHCTQNEVRLKLLRMQLHPEMLTASVQTRVLEISKRLYTWFTEHISS